MTNILRDYLRAYAEWLDAGAPHLEPFSRSYGLCGNVAHFELTVGDKRWRDLILALDEALEADFGKSPYPFGREAYASAWFADEQHLDLRRVAWVRRKLATLKELAAQ